MKVGIIGNTTKPMIWDVVPEFLSWLRTKGVSDVLSKDLGKGISFGITETCDRHRIGACCDLVVAFGGDGTMLATARAIGAQETPILGVNLGGLGFLAEVVIENLTRCMEQVLAGDYRIETRLLLEATVLNRKTKGKLFGLNDIVIDKGDFSRVIRLETYVDGEYLNTYTADGLIVSTPTGSTGYCLSTGGPILEPTLKALVVIPISPHALAARPVVIPDNRKIKIVVYTEHKRALLSADGQIESFLKSGDAVAIRKADHCVRLVMFQDKTFYELLRKKLKWSGGVENQESE